METFKIFIYIIIIAASVCGLIETAKSDVKFYRVWTLQYYPETFTRTFIFACEGHFNEESLRKKFKISGRIKLMINEVEELTKSEYEWILDNSKKEPTQPSVVNPRGKKEQEKILQTNL